MNGLPGITTDLINMQVKDNQRTVPRSKAIHEVPLSSFYCCNYTHQPHASLAALPLPVYVSVAYDDFLEQALAHAGKSRGVILAKHC